MPIKKCMLLVSVAGFLVSGATGCTGGGSPKPDLARVSGKITLDGTPLQNVDVVFESPNAVIAFGRTNAEGEYELSYDGSAKGAGLGDNVVRITTPLEAPDPSFRDPIPSIYNTRSQLTASVESPETVVDFALESKTRKR
jgi:hypothetical protein